VERIEKRIKFTLNGVTYEHANPRPELAAGSVRRFPPGTEPGVLHLFHTCPVPVPFLANKMGTLANKQKRKPRNLGDSEVYFSGDGGVEFHDIVHT
jgi:hypothetical protein